MQIDNRAIIILAVALFLGLQFTIPATVSAFCNTNADCGGAFPVGSPSCRGNGIYQDYITNTCISQGTQSSSCISSRSYTLVQSCQDQCVSGVCTTGNNYNNNLGTQYTCLSHSYQKCVGNAVYWYNSCNTKQGLVTTCSTDQMCQGNACFAKPAQNNIPTAHFAKICSDNDVYWFDSNGFRQDIFQKCNSGDTCLNGVCLNSQNNTGQNLNPAATNTPAPTDQNTNNQVQNTNQAVSNSTAAVSGSSIIDFFKKWWVWILVVFVITVLFVVIFRRLSKDA